MAWNGSADVLPLSRSSNGWRLLLWLLLLISASLLLRYKWRCWFLKLDLLKRWVLRIVQNLGRNNSWTFIALTSHRSGGSCHPWMMISTNRSAHPARVLIKRLITVLHLSSLLKLIFHLVHILLRRKITTSWLLLHPQHFLIFITFELCYLRLVYAFSELLICYFTGLRLAL